MDTARAFEALGISLGLGLLVGLQRERAGSKFGGFRTFPIITMAGTITGFLAMEGLGGWVIAAGLLAVVATIAVSNFLALKQNGEREPGATSEFAAILMFALGAYSVFGPPAVVLAIGAGTALLLYAKQSLHGFAARIGESDMRAMMLFAAITFIILPVLPDRTYGPLNVLNPHNIWLMVVLVVGISLGGYVAYKIFGKGAGTVLSGVLGGLISSTATTVTYARRAAHDPANTLPAVLVIVIAGSIVYARLLVEISVTAPTFFESAVGPLSIMFGVSTLLSMIVWLITRRAPGFDPDHANPTELKSALVFAALYALITLAVAAGERYFQNRGLFIVASISGLTDMDAITLSTARIVDSGGISPHTGWKAILIASISNMLFKTGIILVLAGPRLFKWSVIICSIKIATAISLILFWPYS